MAQGNQIEVGQVMRNHGVEILGTVDDLTRTVAYKFAYDLEETDDQRLVSIDPAIIAILLQILGPLLEQLLERIASRCDDNVSQVASSFRGAFLLRNQLRGKLREQFNSRNDFHFRNRREKAKAVNTCIDSIFEVARATNKKASEILKAE